MIFDSSPQGSPEWLAIRKGVITASRFKDARERLKNGQPAAKCMAYAFDVARERCGGAAAPVFQSSAMRFGTEQEPMARMHYEAQTGAMIEEVGFAYTEDRKFGLSVDGLIGDDGVWECKTMVSSDTLFTALVDGDISAYKDQCNGALWLLGRKWVDLSLWCADLQLLHTIRITRDEDAIEALETDLVAFEKTVSALESKLRALLPAPQASEWTDEGADTFPLEPVEGIDKLHALTAMETDSPGVAA